MTWKAGLNFALTMLVSEELHRTIPTQNAGLHIYSEATTLPIPQTPTQGRTSRHIPSFKY